MESSGKRQKLIGDKESYVEVDSRSIEHFITQDDVTNEIHVSLPSMLIRMDHVSHNREYQKIFTSTFLHEYDTETDSTHYSFYVNIYSNSQHLVDSFRCQTYTLPLCTNSDLKRMMDVVYCAKDADVLINVNYYENNDLTKKSNVFTFGAMRSTLVEKSDFFRMLILRSDSEDVKNKITRLDGEKVYIFDLNMTEDQQHIHPRTIARALLFIHTQTLVFEEDEDLYLWSDILKYIETRLNDFYSEFPDHFTTNQLERYRNELFITDNGNGEWRLNIYMSTMIYLLKELQGVFDMYGMIESFNYMHLLFLYNFESRILAKSTSKTACGRYAELNLFSNMFRKVLDNSKPFSCIANYSGGQSHYDTVIKETLTHLYTHIKNNDISSTGFWKNLNLLLVISKNNDVYSHSRSLLKKAIYQWLYHMIFTQKIALDNQLEIMLDFLYDIQSTMFLFINKDRNPVAFIFAAMNNFCNSDFTLGLRDHLTSVMEIDRENRKDSHVSDIHAFCNSTFADGTLYKFLQLCDIVHTTNGRKSTHHKADCLLRSVEPDGILMRSHKISINTRNKEPILLSTFMNMITFSYFFDIYSETQTSIANLHIDPSLCKFINDAESEITVVITVLANVPAYNRYITKEMISDLPNIEKIMSITDNPIAKSTFVIKLNDMIQKQGDPLILTFHSDDWKKLISYSKGENSEENIFLNDLWFQVSFTVHSLPEEKDVLDNSFFKILCK